MRSVLSLVVAAAVLAPMTFVATPVLAQESEAPSILDGDAGDSFKISEGDGKARESDAGEKEAAEEIAAAKTAVPERKEVTKPKVTPTPKPAYLQTLELKGDIAERNYYSEPNESNLGRFIGIQQRLIAAQCFGKLRESLEYAGYPEEEHCRALIKKVLAVDGNSPVANCAQYGIDSRQCIEASDAVRPGVYFSDSGNWNSFDRSKTGTFKLIDSSVTLRERSLSKKFTEVDKELNNLAASYRVTPDKEIKKQYEQKLQDQLKLVCLDEEWVVSPAETKSAATSSEETTSAGDVETIRPDEDSSGAKGGSNDDLLAGVLDSLERAKPTAVPTVPPIKFEGPNFIHYRLNPNGCNRYIQKAMEFIPASPVVICYRDGGVSPSCIQARRRHVAGGPGAKKSVNAFESF